MSTDNPFFEGMRYGTLKQLENMPPMMLLVLKIAYEGAKPGQRVVMFDKVWTYNLLLAFFETEGFQPGTRYSCN